jgi:6-phosphogluconate dehydrogenase
MEKGTSGGLRAGHLALPNSVLVMVNAGVPSDGTTGTGAGRAGKGSLCIDSTNGTLYQNTNTKASPTWTAR